MRNARIFKLVTVLAMRSVSLVKDEQEVS